MDIAKSSYVMIYLITIINVDILITLMNIVWLGHVLYQSLLLHQFTQPLAYYSVNQGQG